MFPKQKWSETFSWSPFRTCSNSLLICNIYYLQKKKSVSINNHGLYPGETRDRFTPFSYSSYFCESVHKRIA